MKPVDVACFGEALWDMFEVDDGLYRRLLGGSSANVAVTLARLGMRASVVGATGTGAFGQDLKRQLDANGVDTRHLAGVQRPTGITFITHGPKREPRYVNYREGSAGVADLPRSAKAPMRAAWAVLATCTLLAQDTAGVTLDFLDFARVRGMRVAVDLNKRPFVFAGVRTRKERLRFLLARAHLVKASDHDLEAIYGHGAREFLEEHRRADGCLLFTHGPKGAEAIGPHGTVRVPARRARCVDATGAGDAFLAGVLAALLAAPGDATWSSPTFWRRALEVGHMLGAKAVRALGATEGVRDLDDVRGALGRIRTMTRVQR
jgi:fructokinase